MRLHQKICVRLRDYTIKAISGQVTSLIVKSRPKTQESLLILADNSLVPSEEMRLKKVLLLNELKGLIRSWLTFKVQQHMIHKTRFTAVEGTLFKD